MFFESFQASFSMISNVCWYSPKPYDARTVAPRLNNSAFVAVAVALKYARHYSGLGSQGARPPDTCFIMGRKATRETTQGAK
jgi:hypothetical protein